MIDGNWPGEPDEESAAAGSKATAANELRLVYFQRSLRMVGRPTWRTRSIAWARKSRNHGSSFPGKPAATAAKRSA